MKELKFETKKGKFVIYDDVDNIGKHLPYDFLTKIGHLKNLTEEQAVEIVNQYYPDCYVQATGISQYYGYKTAVYNSDTALQNLFTLIQNKGLYLFKNPFEYPDCECTEEESCNFSIELQKYSEAEEKTFYNPYIFKLYE